MSTVKCTTKAVRYDTAKDVADLVRSIEQESDRLETISLEANTFGIEPAREIGRALEMCHGLKHLFLNDMFTSRGKSEIPEALSYIFSGIQASEARLLTLDLSDNAIGPVTMPALLPFLASEQCSTLRVLKLHNCGLGIKGGAMLSTALPHLEQLNELVIGRNRLEIDGVRDISMALANLSKLEILELPQNGTKDIGIEALAEAIKANPRLRVLNLNDNVLKGQAGVLGAAVGALDRLESLNFGDCLLQTAGAIDMADAVRIATERTGRSYLRDLWLDGNEIGPGAIDSIVGAVEATLANKTGQVLTLYMSGNNLGEAGCQMLHDSFPRGEKGVELIINDDESADERDDNSNGEEQDEQEQEEEDQSKLVGLVSPPRFGAVTLPSGDWDVRKAEKLTQHELTDLFVAIAVQAFKNKGKLCEKSLEVTTAIYEEAKRRLPAEQSFGVLNALLVSFGMLKDENRHGRRCVISDLRGPLLALKPIAARLSPDQKRCLKVFLNAPSLDNPKYADIKTELLSELWKF